MRNKGITLIALVITIVILLILAGISIGSLGGENGLFAKVTGARKSTIKAEIREQLVLALTELQLEKNGEVTLDNVTQEWAEETLKKYEPLVINDASTSGKKIAMSRNGVIGRYIINENLTIVETEESDSNIEFLYEVFKIEDGKVNILISIRDRENGLTKVKLPDEREILMYGTKEEKTIDYKVELGKEYKIEIISENGEKKEKIILIEEYWYNVTKKLDDGVSLDNLAIKTLYNKPYIAQIITKEDYIIDNIILTMGGQHITTSGNNIVDVSTGKIYIENVTENIEITVTTKKLEITITEPYIGTSNIITDSNKSVADNSQVKGTSLFINFKAISNVSGATYTISPNLPYAITKNGTYKFTITATYGSKNKEIEKEIMVKKYESAQGLVKYDAGEWTKEEIEKLKKLSSYNINTSKTANNGLKFTFGGFTYNGDTANLSYINNGTVITSRNQSVAPASIFGTPKYDGWQILEIKDYRGNIIKTETEINKKLDNLENEKIYVTKLIHAGSPENFVMYYDMANDAYRAEYIISSGQRKTSYNTCNPRDWSMYIDKNQSELINEVHIMTYQEAYDITGSNAGTTDIRNIGSYYYLGNAYDHHYVWYVLNGTAKISYCSRDSLGIRPVVTLKDGVYIASGDGTEGNEYILAKE